MWSLYSNSRLGIPEEFRRNSGIPDSSGKIVPE
jgi:hypothetical protein